MIVLDTHVLIWAVEDDKRLGPQSRAMIEAESGDGNVLVAAITPWEIAMLVQKGRLVLSQDLGRWMSAVLALRGIQLAPLLADISLDSVRLPGLLHGDPADRVIVATARHARATLLTADRTLLTYAGLGHLTAADAAE